ncbi:hypothetical protein [Pseudovibrio exalbescens]|nr:hypothetical protein [Pseudovibrio exalbescens]
MTLSDSTGLGGNGAFKHLGAGVSLEPLPANGESCNEYKSPF